MNENYTREIDLIDLFIDWISHWRSLIVFILIGVIGACGYMYAGKGAAASNITSEAVIEIIAEDATLSTLTAEQLSEITVKEMEEIFLSQKDMQAVDEVIGLINEYNENLAEYQKSKAKMKLKDRTEAFNYLASSKNIIEARKAALTADQQIYLYEKLGVSTVVGENEAKASAKDASKAAPVETTTSASTTKAILIIVVAFVLHFIIFACKYMFNGNIKHSDSISYMVNVPEYTRMVDWNRIDSSKGLDKLVNKMRFANTRKTSLEDVVEINSSATVEKLKNKEYNSVAVVGTGIEAERNMFANQLLKDMPNAKVKSIESITHSVNGADDIAGVNAAILAVKVGESRYNEFFEELQSLRDRDVDVIGIAIFE